MPITKTGIPNQDDPNRQWEPNRSQTSTGGGGGCGPGMIETSLDANGKYVEGHLECVTPEEAQKRANATGRDVVEWPTAGAEGGAGGPQQPGGKYALPNLPMFNAPSFDWGEEFRWPSAEEAYNDPYYQFGVKEGTRALDQSAAGKGTLRTGGHLKDIYNYGLSSAQRQLKDVADRYLTGYQTRFNTKRSIFDTEYTAAKDKYSPLLLQYQAQLDANKNSWQKAWDDYWRNTLSASEVFNAGLPQNG